AARARSAGPVRAVDGRRRFEAVHRFASFRENKTMGKPLLGQMMDMPLLVSSLIAHAARHAGDTEIVSKRVEGDLHRYTYRDCERRAKQLAQALA
ncbi:long-chain-fatty-acid--CoA ligase, partial [Burkholderia sp. TJI49]